MTGGEELYRKDPVTGEFVPITAPGPTEPVSAESGTTDVRSTRSLPFPARPSHEATAPEPEPEPTPTPTVRSGRRVIIRRTLVGSGALVAAFIVLGAILAATGGHKSASTEATISTDAAVVSKPLPCSHFDLTAMPNRCLTPKIKREIAA